jgi:hypothetical protein
MPIFTEMNTLLNIKASEKQINQAGSPSLTPKTSPKVSPKTSPKVSGKPPKLFTMFDNVGFSKSSSYKYLLSAGKSSPKTSLFGLQERPKAAEISAPKVSILDFEVMKTLGTGSFGRVQLCKRLGTEKHFAIKVRYLTDPR